MVLQPISARLYFAWGLKKQDDITIAWIYIYIIYIYIYTLHIIAQYGADVKAETNIYKDVQPIHLAAQNCQYRKWHGSSTYFGQAVFCLRVEESYTWWKSRNKVYRRKGEEYIRKRKHDHIEKSGGVEVQIFGDPRMLKKYDSCSGFFLSLGCPLCEEEEETETIWLEG